MTLRSPLLEQVPGIRHGFGDLHAPIPAEFLPAWESSKARWKQVHGTGSAELKAIGQEAGEVDALWSRAPGVPTGVVTADCVPILMARADGGAVAAIHAGWRGTHAHMLLELWVKLVAAGERPENWVAAIGPAIGPCCYEVSAELAADFEQEFGIYDPDLVVPRERHLDLPSINAAELHTVGLKQVEMLRLCTRCFGGDEPVFHSYRREGGGTRQYSIIARDP
jgi:YfiH family protein